MENNMFTKNLAGIMAHAQSFIAQIKTGEGIKFSEDPAENEKKRLEFLEQMKSQGGVEKVKELESTMAKFKEKLKQANNVANTPVK